jgi:putative ABC transport system permease protein
MLMTKGNYGFDKELVLNIKLPPGSLNKLTTALNNLTGVERISATSHLLGISEGNTNFIRKQLSDDSLQVARFSVSPSFIPNMGIKIIAGQNLPDDNADAAIPSVLINEVAAHHLQYAEPGEAVGQRIWLTHDRQAQISGVVKDFHYTGFFAFYPTHVDDQPTG